MQKKNILIHLKRTVNLLEKYKKDICVHEDCRFCPHGENESDFCYLNESIFKIKDLYENIKSADYEEEKTCIEFDGNILASNPEEHKLKYVFEDGRRMNREEYHKYQNYLE